MRVPLSLAALALAALAAASGGEPATRDAIAKIVTSGATTVAGERICSATAVRTFYTRRNFEPAWDEQNVVALLSAIDAAREDGLEPDAYHANALRVARTSVRAPERGLKPAPHEGDVLATDAFCLLGAHLSQGRVEPQFLRPAWCIEPRLDLAAILQAALDHHQVEDTLARLAPRHEGYRRLRSALAEHRRIEQQGGWPAIAEGMSLRKAVRNPRVAALRQRLGLPPGDLFDDDADRAVRDFQSHHGLAADGVAGAATRRELNVPVADRIEQLVVNLERWRWMPDDLGARYAIVNIAAFRLDVMEGDRTVLSMKTVVGKQFTKTPFFAAKITQVVVNPPWNVPESIATKELWPKQQLDPSFFGREHIEVTRGGGLRQTPGPWNSLGQLKFDMPNRFNVYLHDTPAKGLFDLSVRAFSHGCIRLERPLDFATYLLHADAESIENAIAAGKETAIPLAAPVPVYVLYWTAWMDEHGDVTFHRDLYDRDAALARALRE